MACRAPGWRSVRVLLLTEGESDRDTLPVLVRKMVGRTIGVEAQWVGRGDLLSTEKVVVHLSTAVRRHRDIRKALLCIDSECTPIEETRAKIQGVVRTVADRFRSLAVKAVVVDHSLEGWLLGDKGAVAGFLGIQPRRLNYRNPEEECQPAKLMGRIFRRAGRDFVKTGTLASLAEAVDVQGLAHSSPTFRDFQQTLLNS